MSDASSSLKSMLGVAESPENLRKGSDMSWGIKI